jgi:hypothetical protein
MSKAATEGDRLLSCSSLFSLFNNVAFVPWPVVIKFAYQAVHNNPPPFFSYSGNRESHTFANYMHPIL